MMQRDFGPWLAWSSRQCLNVLHRPGVYVLARFDELPPEVVHPLSADVIYIGRTGRSFDERFEEFGRTVTKRVGGHSGAWTFSELFCKGKPSEVPDWLYIAACAFASDEIDQIEAFKAQLLNDYRDRHARPPTCNTKMTG